MAGSEPSGKSAIRYGDLLPRALVGAGLLVLAVVADWVGGWPFYIVITAMAVLLFGEWANMHRIGTALRAVGCVLVVVVCLIAGYGFVLYALVLMAAGAAALFVTSRDGGAGIVYTALPAAALIWLRGEESGRELVIWTLATVWATDICAYFAGRTIGGPKIAPQISPSKTWAGLAGGMIGAAIAAAVLASIFAFGFEPPVAAALGACLAVASQIGDFYESHLKRRAGVKDSSHLLPGHGGVMDRLDGVVPVAVLVALTVWLLR